jgi:ABC-type nitrate/sulfonate/bicarbonate transport system permease component
VNRSHPFNWLGWSSFALLLVIWELIARATPKLSLYFPPVSRILAALGEALIAGSIIQHGSVTLGKHTCFPRG